MGGGDATRTHRTEPTRRRRRWWRSGRLTAAAECQELRMITSLLTIPQYRPAFPSHAADVSRSHLPQFILQYAPPPTPPPPPLPPPPPPPPPPPGAGAGDRVEACVACVASLCCEHPSPRVLSPHSLYGMCHRAPSSFFLSHQASRKLTPLCTTPPVQTISPRLVCERERDGNTSTQRRRRRRRRRRRGTYRNQ